MSPENGVTPASEWGQQDEVVELPSGQSARLRQKLNVWTLFRRGVMTPQLLEAYEKAEKGQLDDLSMAIELNDLILSEMFVEPRVFVPDEENEDLPEGWVHVDRIDDEDVTFVLERAFRGARDITSFRGDGRGAGPGGDGEDVGENPVGAAGAGDGDAAGVPAGQKARSQARRAGTGRKSSTGRKKAAARS